jgi:hypothetical protein
MIVQPSRENISESSSMPEVQRGQILDINGKTLAITTTGIRMDKKKNICNSIR